MRLFLLMDAALILLYSIGAWMVVPTFAELLEGFSAGLDMPVLSVAVYHGYPWWPLMLLIPASLYGYTELRGNSEAFPSARVSNLAAGLMVFLAGWFPLALWGLYMPIFILGEPG